MLAFGALPAAAAQSVDLELVLAVDVSRSIDADEARLQRQGYATALTDARIIGAIRRGRLGRIAATYVEWAETQTRQVVVERNRRRGQRPRLRLEHHPGGSDAWLLHLDQRRH
jgi:predicted alpha/beta hydrolase